MVATRSVRVLRRELLSAMSDVVEAAESLRKQMLQVRSLTQRSARHIEQGGRVSDLRATMNIASMRASNDQALERLAAARLRAQRAQYRLASAEGLRAAEIARIYGVSRQLVSRVLNEPAL